MHENEADRPPYRGIGPMPWSKQVVPTVNAQFSRQRAIHDGEHGRTALARRGANEIKRRI